MHTHTQIGTIHYSSIHICATNYIRRNECLIYRWRDWNYCHISTCAVNTHCRRKITRLSIEKMMIERCVCKWQISTSCWNKLKITSFTYITIVLRRINVQLISYKTQTQIWLWRKQRFSFVSCHSEQWHIHFCWQSFHICHIYAGLWDSFLNNKGLVFVAPKKLKHSLLYKYNFKGSRQCVWSHTFTNAFNLLWNTITVNKM